VGAPAPGWPPPLALLAVVLLPGPFLVGAVVTLLGRWYGESGAERGQGNRLLLVLTTTPTALLIFAELLEHCASLSVLRWHAY